MVVGEVVVDGVRSETLDRAVADTRKVVCDPVYMSNPDRNHRRAWWQLAIRSNVSTWSGLLPIRAAPSRLLTQASIQGRLDDC